jgi:hypothetical protein
MAAIVALASAFIAIMACVASLVSNHRRRSGLKKFTEQLLNLERQIDGLNRDLDTATERATHQARRIAWLESRVRPGKQFEELRNPESSIEAKGRPPITERRHRVLTLAQRGQAAEAIAATLNMAQGEVELIIGLSKAA